jgi:anaerobic selenocysteine-containing dehydrogenase
VESRRGDASLRKQYPLEMISSKNHDNMNSTFGERAAVDAATSLLRLHPKDAGPRRIQTGDRVRVFNGRGSLLLKAEVGDEVLEGVVQAPSVRWPKRAMDGRNANVLTSGRLTDIGAGPTFYSCLVEVERCGD